MMLRFTIRDLLWLTVVVAMGVGWWADHGANRAARVENVLYEERAFIIAEILKNTIKCLNAEGYKLSVTPDNRVSLERLSPEDNTRNRGPKAGSGGTLPIHPPIPPGALPSSNTTIIPAVTPTNR